MDRRCQSETEVGSCLEGHTGCLLSFGRGHRLRYLLLPWYVGSPVAIIEGLYLSPYARRVGLIVFVGGRSLRAAVPALEDEFVPGP